MIPHKEFPKFQPNNQPILEQLKLIARLDSLPACASSCAGGPMRLSELEPKWLIFEGRRVGFVFRCPLPGRREQWQTCFVEKFYLFKSRSGTYPQDESGEWIDAPDSQCGIVNVALGKEVAESCRWQGCNVDCQWVVEGGIEAATFETISVTPSLDGSKGGNWHGHVTSGEIVGGV